MMMLRVLTEKEIENIYYYDMQRDFPKEEIKPLKTILELRNQGYYQCYGSFENETLCAYLFFVWDSKALSMLDYFAVIPEFRNHGIGSKSLLLAGMERKKEGCSCILFEIERISLSKSEEQKQKRIKRKHFYLQQGCKESGLKSKIFGVGYEILYLLLEEKQINCEKGDYYQEKMITLQEIEQDYINIYHRMVKKEYYDENVLIF